MSDRPIDCKRYQSERGMANALFHENEQLKAELERVKAQAAEMRSILEEMQHNWSKGSSVCSVDAKEMCHALSGDAGKDYIPKVDMKPLVEAILEAKTYLNGAGMATAAWQICDKALDHAKAKGWIS